MSVDSVVLVATWICSGNKQKVRHFRKCFDFVIELNCVNCIEFTDSWIIRSPSNQRVHCSLSLPNEPTSSPAEPVFIRPTYLTLSLNKNGLKQLWHIDIHCISVFTNFNLWRGVHYGKHRHQPFQKLVQIFVGLELKIFKPREFYSIKTFAVEYPWVEKLSWQSWVLLNRLGNEVTSNDETENRVKEKNSKGPQRVKNFIFF